MTQGQKSLKELEIALDMSTIKIKDLSREKDEAYELLAKCTLTRNAAEMRIEDLKSQLMQLCTDDQKAYHLEMAQNILLIERKDKLEEWLTELRDNLKNGNTIDNDTLSNEINELLNESTL